MHGTGCCEWWIKRSKRVATLEFDRVRKSMSVLVREPTGHNRLLVKVTAFPRDICKNWVRYAFNFC